MRFRQVVVTSALYGSFNALLSRRECAKQLPGILMLTSMIPKDTFGEIGFLFALQQLVMSLSLGGLVEAVSGRLNGFWNCRGKHTDFRIQTLVPASGSDHRYVPT